MKEIIKNNVKSWMTKDNLIAEGSTREVYRADKFVIKKHTHPLGYEQSKNEEMIYNATLSEEWREFLARPYYTGEEYAIFEYIKPLETNPIEGGDVRCWDIDKTDGDYELAIQELAIQHEAGLVEWLEKEYGIIVDDLYLSHNLGIRENPVSFVFLDYGMDKELMEQHDNAILRGEIAYHVVEVCPVCKGDAIFKIKGENELLISCAGCELSA